MSASADLYRALPTERLRLFEPQGIWRWNSTMQSTGNIIWNYYLDLLSSTWPLCNLALINAWELVSFGANSTAIEEPSVENVWKNNLL